MELDKTCRYCGIEIRPLDRHAHSMSPDKDSDKTGGVLITCILNRSYILAAERNILTTERTRG